MTTALLLSVQTTDTFTERLVDVWQKAHASGEYQWFLSVEVDTLTNIVTVVENPDFTGEPKTHTLTPYMLRRGVERITLYDIDPDLNGVTGQMQKVIVEKAYQSNGNMPAVCADAILQVACWTGRKFT